MDFIKGNDLVRIDPSGIDISGEGHIVIDSNSITGDISITGDVSMNGKVSISDNFDVTGDISMNGKVSISDNFDVTGDISMNGKVSISDNFDVTGDVALNGKVSISDNFDVTGNVGIGTTDPRNKLEISDGNISFGDFTQRGAGGISFVGVFDTTSNPLAGMEIENTSLNGSYSQKLHLRTHHFGTSEGRRMTIAENGNVGIGTSSPSYPLEISDRGLTSAFVSNFSWYNARGGWAGDQNTTETIQFPDGISAKFWGGLWIAGSLTDTKPEKTGVIYSSDERIKTNITLIDDDLALKKVNALESKEYNYKGTFGQAEHKTIGFIAQDVFKVIPEAVSFQTQIIPDEMRIISEPQWGNLVLTIPDLDMSANNFTGKCKFYVSNDPSGNDEIKVEIESEKDASGNNTNQFKFEEEYNNVFFYGKEVNDFHTIDKNQIFALHHSAIQELDRKLKREYENKDEKIASLEVRLESLETFLLTVLSKQEEIIAKNTELESKLNSIITINAPPPDNSSGITLL